MPNLYIIAGCNGAGKTTASLTILPEILNCKEFINADEIARELSPSQPDAVALEAGRLMLTKINDALDQEIDFAIETTLSTKSYVSLIKKAKKAGYKVSLLFFWLDSSSTAKERVRHRVIQGGHNIPEDVIERRYTRGIQNLIRLYIPIVDYWNIFNNMEGIKEIAEGRNAIDFNIINPEIWDRIKNG